MNEPDSVIIKIGKLTPQVGDIIVIKLPSHWTPIMMQEYIKYIENSFPTTKFLWAGTDMEISVIKGNKPNTATEEETHL